MATILRYKPWSVLKEIQDEVNQMFEQNLASKQCQKQVAPEVDIAEGSDHYRVMVDLPGVKPSEIKLTVENNVMTIQAERKTECHPCKGSFSRVERFSGNYYRQFVLPEKIDPSSIEAKSKHGVLEVTLGKKELAIPKSIEIKVEDADLS